MLCSLSATAPGICTTPQGVLQQGGIYMYSVCTFALSGFAETGYGALLVPSPPPPPPPPPSGRTGPRQRVSQSNG